MKIKIRRKTKKYISALLIAVFLVCCVSFFTLRKVEAGSDIIAIDTYGGFPYHVLALKSDGTVWAWGNNQFGQIGIGTAGGSGDFRVPPVKVQNLTNVVAIAAGEYSSYALKSDGTVWAWGRNNYGQLGDGTTTDRYTPVRVKNISGVKDIRMGSFYGYAIRNDNIAWAWGYIWSEDDNGLPHVLVNRFEPSHAKLSMRIGETKQITVNGKLILTGINTDLSNRVVYSSADPSIAEVNNNGLVTAKKTGNTEIQVTYNCQTCAVEIITIPVTVEAALTSISVSPSVVTIWKGETSQLTVTAHFSDGTTEDVTSKATYQPNTDAVTVNSTGEVRGNEVGHARILVTYDVASTYVDVNVLEPVVEKITVIPEGGNIIRRGGTTQVITTAIMSDGTIKNVTNEANYESSDPSIATVSDTGLVKGLDVGSVTITAEYDNKADTVKIEVDPKLYIYIRRLM